MWVSTCVWLLPDRERKGDMLFACKASHPWRCSAFLKTFTLHLINRWTCSVVDFSESPVPLRAVLAATNAASDGRGSTGIPEEWEGADLFSPSNSIPQVTFDAFG